METSPSVLLQQLRDENAQRWRQIEDLHEQQQQQQQLLLVAARAEQQQQDDDDNGSSTDDEKEQAAAKHLGNQILNSLQVEIDLLSQNGVYAKCDRLLQHLDGSSVLSTAELEDSFASEVFHSTRQIVSTDRVLKEAIQREVEKLEAMQTSIAEQTAIQQKLIEMEASATCGQTNRAADERSIESGRTEEELNQQLKQDLRYLAGCIDNQVEVESDKADQQHNDDQPMTLEELVSKLLERLIMSPEDPYLSVSDDRIQTKHVELLEKCWMVLPFKDDKSLIRLVDYHM